MGQTTYQLVIAGFLPPTVFQCEANYMFNLHLRAFFWKECSRQGWIAHHHLPGVVGNSITYLLNMTLQQFVNLKWSL